MKPLKFSFSKQPLSYIGIIYVCKYSINSKDNTWFKRSHITQRISYEIIYFYTYCGIIQVRGWGPILMFASKQVFADSWGRYFVGKLGDVTRENDSYLIYLQTTERFIFLIFYYATKQSYLSCKYFDASSYCGVVKTSKGLSSALYCKNNDHN